MNKHIYNSICNPCISQTVDKVTVNLKNIMKSFFTFPMGLKHYTNISIEEDAVS